MARKNTTVWYDITVALTYPSVLGAIFYYFLDTTAQLGAIPLMNSLFKIEPGAQAQPLSQAPFLAALDLHRVFTVLAFGLLTAFTIVHFFADFLYSKYSQTTYSRAYFLFDLLITITLALAYISMSILSRQ